MPSCAFRAELKTSTSFNPGAVKVFIYDISNPGPSQTESLIGTYENAYDYIPSGNNWFVLKFDQPGGYGYGTDDRLPCYICVKPKADYSIPIGCLPSYYEPRNTLTPVFLQENEGPAAFTIQGWYLTGLQAFYDEAASRFPLDPGAGACVEAAAGQAIGIVNEQKILGPKFTTGPQGARSDHWEYEPYTPQNPNERLLDTCANGVKVTLYEAFIWSPCGKSSQNPVKPFPKNEDFGNLYIEFGVAFVGGIQLQYSLVPNTPHGPTYDLTQPLELTLQHEQGDLNFFDYPSTVTVVPVA